MSKGNINIKTVNRFGDEWSRFDQSALLDEELLNRFEEYFSFFPWEDLSCDSIGFDVGYGSGRWEKLMAPRAGLLHCIDPSSALDRFGTKLEHRHTKEKIRNMMQDSGLENIVFSPAAPYWCAMGYKKTNTNQ